MFIALLVQSFPIDLFEEIHNRLVNITCTSTDFNGTETATVLVGNIVTVTCTANFPNGINMTDGYPLWRDEDGLPLAEDQGGVVGISQENSTSNSASSVLQVQASVIGGAKWPKSFEFVVKVVLPDGDELIRKSKPFPIDIVGELHLAIHHAYMFVLVTACACVGTYKNVCVFTHVSTC